MILKFLYTAIFLFGINDFASSNESADPAGCPCPKEWSSPKDCTAHCPKSMPCPVSPAGTGGSVVKPVTPATLPRPAGNKTPEPLLTTAGPAASIPSILFRPAEVKKINQEEKKRTSADTDKQLESNGKSGDFSPLLVALYI